MVRASRLAVLGALLDASIFARASTEGSHQEHCPWTKPWEWAGMFHFHDEGLHAWNAEKQAVSGAYAEPSMKLMILNASAASGEGLEELEETAEGLWNGTWMEVRSGAALSVGVAYTLVFDADMWTSHFKLNITAGSNLAFFAEHVPTEFERHSHYLKAASGEDLEPVLVESSQECSVVNTVPVVNVATKDRWGEVFAASLVTTLPSLVGIAGLALAFNVSRLERLRRAMAPVNFFASGVIFAAAAFLLLPESHHLVSAGQTEEAEGTWRWGSAILGGWMLGAAIDHGSGLLGAALRRRRAAEQGVKPCDIAGDSCAHHDSAAPSEGRSALSVAGPVIFGDMFHNLADGFVIGVAFKSCDPSFAWKIAGISVVHEVPQEVADVSVLVSKAGMSFCGATAANFASAISSIVGAFIAYGVDVSPQAQGVILAIGAGVYLYVALTELGPDVAHLDEDGDHSHPLLKSSMRLGCFMIGAVCIGLVLLDHVHCEAEAADVQGVDAHAGHNHR